MVVVVIAFRHPGAIGHFQQRAETVGHGFIGTHYPKIAVGGIEFHNIPQIIAQDTGSLAEHATGSWHCQRVVVIIGQLQVV